MTRLKPSLSILQSPTVKVGLFCFLLLLTGCRRAENPDDVTIAFWTALAEYDLPTAAYYSTDSSVPLFNERLRNASLQVGRVRYVCNGATVETHIELQSAAAGSTFQTILVRDEAKEMWKVDYPATVAHINEATDKKFKSIIDSTKEVGKEVKVTLWSFMKELANSVVIVFKNLLARLLS
jgi:hypothetical protein